MLDCPNCGELLSPIHITTSGRGSITIHHCVNCSGTWFDNYDINRLTLTDVYRIAASSLIKKREIPWGKLDRLCPRDFHPLQRFKTEVTQENLNIERCPHCGGIFIMQKDLEKLKLAQTAKINIFKSLNIPFPSLHAFFIPIFFVGLLLFSTFLTVTNLENAKESETKAKEEISSVTNVSIDSQSTAILFLTESPVVSSLEYGTNLFDQKVLVVSQTPQISHKITLTKLSPNTTYHFYIILTLPTGEKVVSQQYSFTTGK